MDILSLISNEELAEFASAYTYKKNFMGQKLFPMMKTDNLKIAIRQLQENGDLPVMAQAHALDTEARIGDRPNFTQVNYEKVLIKEKLPLSERIAEFLGEGASRSRVIDFIYDDVNNLISRVITRTEVANMELLSTGQVTYDENNYKNVVKYKVNNVSISDWSVNDADILGDIVKVQRAAKKKGKKIVRAITSSTMLGYIQENPAVKEYWLAKTEPLTESALLAWLNANYGIEFVVNDDVYKTSALSSTVHSFYPEKDVVTFIATRGAVGRGLYGETPEERQELGTSFEMRKNMFVTVTRWKEPDPATVWTKASGVYVPVPTDLDNIFIAKHEGE